MQNLGKRKCFKTLKARVNTIANYQKLTLTPAGSGQPSRKGYPGIQPMPSHDLVALLQQASANIQQEYERVSARAIEDPGTAGDQGEENWARVLREWLPSHWHVETKGRILNDAGEASPQVDVLVLDPNYPQGLLKTKLFLAAGVLAAFECKLTLRKRHIAEALENAAKISRAQPQLQGSPYKELNSGLIYGVLAHSHEWKANATGTLSDELKAADLAVTKHPREMLDVVCVSDLGTWTAFKSSLLAESAIDDGYEKFYQITTPLSASSAYMLHRGSQQNLSLYEPIGAMLSDLYLRLAWQCADLRRIAEYFRAVGLQGSYRGYSRDWPLTIYSVQVGAQLERSNPPFSHKHWDEWQIHFPG
jgi:hypothetical protein